MNPGPGDSKTCAFPYCLTLPALQGSRLDESVSLQGILNVLISPLSTTENRSKQKDPGSREEGCGAQSSGLAEQWGLPSAHKKEWVGVGMGVFGPRF